MQNKIASPPKGVGDLALTGLSCFIDLISLFLHLFPKAQPVQPLSPPQTQQDPLAFILLFPLQDSPCPHLIGFRSLLKFNLIRRLHWPHNMKEQMPPSLVSFSLPLTCFAWHHSTFPQVIYYTFIFFFSYKKERLLSFSFYKNMYFKQARTLHWYNPNQAYSCRPPADIAKCPAMDGPMERTPENHTLGQGRVLGGSQRKKANVASWRNPLFVWEDQICDLEKSLGQSETWVQLFS